MKVAAGLVVLLPLLGAAASVWARGRMQALVGTFSAGATVLAAIALIAEVWRSGATTVLRLAGPANLEVVLIADGLGTAMVVMTSVTGGFVSAFAVVDHLHDPTARHRAYWPVWLTLWGCLHLLFLAGDLLTVYLMFEAVGVAGVALVVLGGDRRTVLAGTRYLYAELVATTTVLIGIAVVWHQTGTLVLAELGPALTASPSGWWALGMITAGLLIKVPLAPLHFWLPAAHALAPSAVSPVLSAVVVKSAFVVLVRLWFLTVPTLVTRGAAQLLGWLGVVAIAWGSLAALRAIEVKRLIAYSTVAQLGFLFLLPPLFEGGAGDAWSGGILYAIAHAFAKAAMLMAAAVLVEDARRPQIVALTGAATRRPVAVFAIGVAALSLVGLPPSGGFVAQWYLLVASFETGQWWWLAPIVVGSLMTAAYLMRLLKPALAAPEDGSTASMSTTGDGREWIALALAATTVVLGLRPTELLELIGVGAPSTLLGGG